MSELQRGLYEQLVTEALEAQLSELDVKYKSLRGQLHGEEAADRIALHLGAVVRRVISGLDSRKRASVGLELARQIVHLLDSAGGANDSTDAPSPAAIGRASCRARVCQSV